MATHIEIYYLLNYIMLMAAIPWCQNTPCSQDEIDVLHCRWNDNVRG